MKTYNVLVSLLFLSLFLGVSCSDMNDLHDEYLKDGETTYIAIFDSIQAFSGRERIQIKYWLSDPKAKHVKIYWDLRAESVTEDIHVTTPDHPGVIWIEDLSEGSISFEMLNYDENFEDFSITMNFTKSVYGKFYQSYLANRLVKSYSYDKSNQKVTINWVSAVYDNAVGTEIKYRNTEGEETVVEFPMDQSTLVIENLPELSVLEFRTLYLPEETGVDTFYTEYTSFLVENPEPEVTGFPMTGKTGKTISFTGTDLDAIEEVWFGNQPGTIGSATATTLTITLPAANELSAGSVILKIKYAGTKEKVISTNFEVTYPLVYKWENVILYGPGNASAALFNLETGTSVDPCTYKDNYQNIAGPFIVIRGSSGGIQISSTRLNNATNQFKCEDAAIPNQIGNREVRFNQVFASNENELPYYNAVKNGTLTSLTVDELQAAGLLSSPKQVARCKGDTEVEYNTTNREGMHVGGVTVFMAWPGPTNSGSPVNVGFIELVSIDRANDADPNGSMTVNIYYAEE